MRRSTRSKTNIEQLEEDGSGMIKKSLHCTTLYVPFVSFWLKNKSTLIARKKKILILIHVVNLYLRSLNWTDVVVLLHSNTLCYRNILNLLFLQKNTKPNKYAISVSHSTLT